MAKMINVLNGKYNVAVCNTDKGFENLVKAFSVRDSSVYLRNGLSEYPVKRFEYFNAKGQQVFGLSYLFVDADSYEEMLVTSLKEIDGPDILKVYDELTEV